MKEYVYTKVRIRGVSEETQKYIIITQSSGKFFEVYDYDAFMFNYLFDYKIIRKGKHINVVFQIIQLLKLQIS